MLDFSYADTSYPRRPAWFDDVSSSGTELSSDSKASNTLRCKFPKSPDLSWMKDVSSSCEFSEPRGDKPDASTKSQSASERKYDLAWMNDVPSSEDENLPRDQI